MQESNRTDRKHLKDCGAVTFITGKKTGIVKFYKIETSGWFVALTFSKPVSYSFGDISCPLCYSSIISRPLRKS